jgi:SSS family solute:Na+ symporter
MADGQHFESVTIVIACLYLLVLLGLGVVGYLRSTPSEEDYYLAGRNQGWFVTSLTIIATFFSAFAFLGAPGAVYRHGVVFALFALNVPLAGATVYLLGARIRRVGQAKHFVTPADMISDYYNSPVTLRLLVALAGYLYAIPYVMIQIKAGGEISAVMFKDQQLSLGAIGTFDSFQVGAVVLSLITMTYIMIGGMRSVAWTDALQGILLIGGMLLGGLAVISAFGGLRGFGEAVSALPATSLTSPGPADSFPWSKMLTIVMFASVGSLVQPAQWMRFYSAASSKSLKRSALLFAIALPPCFLLGVMLVGLGGQSLFPLVGEGADAIAHPLVEQPDRILIVVLRGQLPIMLGATVGTIVASLVIVAIMAASMSTADSNLHALSALTVRDIYDRFFRPQSTQVERLWVGRAVIVITTLLALVMVLRSYSSQSVSSSFDVMRMIALLGLVAIGFSCQLLPLTIDMLFLRRGTAAGAACGLAAGLVGAFFFGGMFDPIAEAAEGTAWGPIVSVIQGLKSKVPMDSTAWGLLWNVPIFVAVSCFTRPVDATKRDEYARLVRERDA